MALNIPLPEVITDLGRVVIEQSYDALSKRSNIVYYLKKSREKVPVLTISTGYLPTDFMGMPLDNVRTQSDVAVHIPVQSVGETLEALVYSLAVIGSMEIPPKEYANGIHTVINILKAHAAKNALQQSSGIKTA